LRLRRPNTYGQRLRNVTNVSRAPEFYGCALVDGGKADAELAKKRSEKTIADSAWHSAGSTKKKPSSQKKLKLRMIKRLYAGSMSHSDRSCL